MTLEHHVARLSVAGTAALVAALLLSVRGLSLSPAAAHAAGHLAVGLPLLGLLVLVLRYWPLRPGLLARVARGTLVTGLALASFGLVAEAVGAFGLDTDGQPATGLATLHEVSNAVWVVGLLAVGVSGLLTSVDLLAQAHGLESSRALAVAGVVVVLAVTVFAVGGMLLSS
ncbi:hypothetical protein ATJ97_3536 [Georgenia soli]|uniref:Copper resistance protein D n=1 Tax=Georgenia soli TaxID=638953 RepID=A0A2A9ER32_9MICO|nr:hypothetical protein [Georgenia soli]PFG40991.1 hypothetical protein ATJ97_3536 [Georgenia soli]